MKKTVNCEICGEEIGWYNHEERIINMYPIKGECDVKHVGRDIIATFKHCDKEQQSILK